MNALKPKDEYYVKGDPLIFNNLKDIKCQIELIQPEEECLDLDDWEISIHGLRILIDQGDEILESILPPQTILNNEWNKETAIRYLAQASGYFGEISMIEDQVKLFKFESLSHKISYAEYRDFTDLE
mmetsp:Transcript_9643/g.8492  ORF Transcript_9643/g.8492 Transcript_9643/m.8492 type:complete len:127 (+) Transcript_9643:159-539(+)